MYDIYGCKVNINMKKYLVNKYVINNMKSTCIYINIVEKNIPYVKIYLLEYIIIQVTPCHSQAV